MAIQSVMINAFRLHASKFMKVSGLCILTYDYAVTLDREVDLMWGTKWCIARSLFYLARYLPFVDAGIYHYCESRSGAKSTNGTPQHSTTATEAYIPTPQMLSPLLRTQMNT
ncbi:hypothetical protein HYDPIDRAFT_27935 [Hydnomerulius pinastri MD-312]|uniref:DUF6533 domain-containing protein n=1 Tax=Hydnomerulius pinastri MD-312 TaxID=994086 RepID=A0A0C9W2I4_9AGAM|nr:hypothetical protein HYDPIDRAFT_27935 [Hydnomerulius pinastri MD-312]